MQKYFTKYKIIILGSINLALYSLLFLIKPLRLMFNDTSLPPYDPFIGSFIMVVLGLLFLNYSLGLWWLRQAEFDKHDRRLVYIFTGAMVIVSLLLWPIASADVFNYIATGKIWLIHQVNPYLVAQNSFSSDQIFPFTVLQWRDKPTPYGPIWTIISGGLAWIGNGQVILSLILQKLAMVLAYVLSGWCIYRLLLKLGRDQNVSFNLMLVWLWNPVLIWEGLVNVHNDLWLLTLVLLAFYLLKAKPVWSLPVLWISVLLKYVSLLLVPLWLVYLWPRLTRRQLFYNLGLIIVIIFLSYWPFLSAGNLLWQGLLQQGTQNNVLSYYGVLPFVLWWFEVGVMNILKIGLIAWGLVAGYFFFKQIKQNSFYNLVIATIVVLLAYLNFMSWWWQPWYWLWIMPLVLLLPQRYALMGIILITGMALGAYSLPIAIIVLLVSLIIIFFIAIKLVFKYDKYLVKKID